MEQKTADIVTYLQPPFKLGVMPILYNAPHVRWEETEPDMRRCASFSVFFGVALLAGLTVALAGCTIAEPVERAREPTGVLEGEEALREPEAPVTVSEPAETSREATVGVASTTREAETSAEAVPEPAVGGEVQAASSPAPFVEDPRARGGAGYGADSILAVRYGLHEGYERVVLDLGTGKKPAGSVPEWVLSSPTGDGVLRVTLPSVSTIGVSDGDFDGPLLKNFHVVRAPEGGMFVDIFAESAFTYRVIELLKPSRLVVDFQPSSATLDVPLPAEGSNTVVTEPRRGTRVGGPVTVSGYSRNFEANNMITVTGPGGEVLARQTVTGNDWASTWGYFETTLDLPPFNGRATLKVGARSARDGSFEGVTVPIWGG